MITTEGRSLIRRVLAQQGFAQSIAFGIGGRAESVNDTALQFEFGRADINLVSFDFVNNRLVYKATLPSEVYGVIYEVGLYSQSADLIAAGNGSKGLTSFDSNELWSAGTFQAGGRISNDSLRLTPAASATTTTTLNSITFDFDQNSNADYFSFAFNNANSNAQQIELRFLNDSTNYFSYVASLPATGYQILTFTKGNFTGVGVPDWSQINGLSVSVQSKAAGASQVDFDGLRIEDADTVNPDYVLISRVLLGTPYSKVEGRVEEIEFSLPVNIS